MSDGDAAPAIFADAILSHGRRASGVASVTSAARPPLWLLVTGAPRSGTTFLNQLLNSHPQVAVATENGLDAIAERLLSLLSLRRIDADGNDVAYVLDDGTRRTFDDLALAAFRGMFGKGDVAVIGDKMPSCDASRLQHRAAFRRLAQIHIVRRPLDVVASSLRRRHNTQLGLDNWHITMIEQAIVEWVEAWERLAKLADDPDVLVVSYERLESEAGEETALIASFLGIEDGLFRHAFVQAQPPFELSGAEHAAAAAVFGHLDALVANDVRSTLHTHPRVLRTLAMGQTFQFSADRPLDGLLLKEGFGEAETFGTWTIGAEATLLFRLAAECRRDAYAILTFSPFWVGRSAFSLVIDDGKERRSHDCERAERCLIVMPCRPDADGIVSLRIELPMRKRAEDEPLADSRALGILLRSLTLSHP